MIIAEILNYLKFLSYNLYFCCTMGVQRGETQ